MGAQFIASALASNKRLQSFVLMLSRNGISDVGAVAMSPVLGLSSQMLSELHLEHNDITSKGGNSLVTGLGNNTALRILGLAGNDMDDSVLENVRLGFLFLLFAAEKVRWVVHIYEPPPPLRPLHSLPLLQPQ